ncbi:MAG: rhomboid family intramembrane serine protease [Paludibacteraceae bacterium]|nr:rhomboid family intramembrane serine protease [Paludibacteraceae bacterium]
MNPFLNKIKDSFKAGNFLTRLIYINAGVFVIIKLALLVCTILKFPTHWVNYLEMPASLPNLLQQPWSIITYMFLHSHFAHAIFNLIALHYLGKLFLCYYNQKQLVAAYIWGGLAGAALYVMGYNLLPYFASYQAEAYLLGASASVMAILFATVGYSPNSQVQLALVGNVKLKYVGWAFLALDLIGLGSVNSGGSMAHLGGAFMGLLFGYCYANGKDLSKPITKALDWLANHYHMPSFKGWGASKKKIKVTVDNTQNMSDAQWNKKQKEREKLRQERIDQILEKIKKSGYQNLTDEEKKSLFDLSKKDE